MASPIVQGWLYATVPIDNPQGESGTGFLVMRKINADQGRVFLVTNKHVVHRDAAQRPGVTHVVCHFNTKNPDRTTGTVAGDVPMTLGADKRWREHPDADTDVLALDVTDVIQLNPTIDKRWAGDDDFGDQAKRDELDITVGEEVLTIGYPLGLRQGTSNFPLVRQGLIATRIGFPINDHVKDASGTLRPRSLRAFLAEVHWYEAHGIGRNMRRHEAS